MTVSTVVLTARQGGRPLALVGNDPLRRFLTRRLAEAEAKTRAN